MQFRSWPSVTQVQITRFLECDDEGSRRPDTIRRLRQQQLLSASLEARKLYQVLPDEVNYIRVIDETGEDYLFREIDIPAAVQEELRRVS